MKIHQYLITLQHDNGQYTIQVPARNKRVATKIIMAAEHCPKNAIVLISRI